MPASLRNKSQAVNTALIILIGLMFILTVSLFLSGCKVANPSAKVTFLDKQGKCGQVEYNSVYDDWDASTRIGSNVFAYRSSAVTWVTNHCPDALVR
jgi:hypothetical protein